MDKTLGQEMLVAGYAVRGNLAEAAAKSLLTDIVSLIGMNTGGMEPAVWTFPMPTGQGGVGQTIAQPIITQPLVESFASYYPAFGSTVVDTWKDFDCFYLLIHSCCPFDESQVATFLESKGLPVIEMNSFSIGFERNKSLMAGSKR